MSELRRVLFDLVRLSAVAITLTVGIGLLTALAARAIGHV